MNIDNKKYEWLKKVKNINVMIQDPIERNIEFEDNEFCLKKLEKLIDDAVKYKLPFNWVKLSLDPQNKNDEGFKITDGNSIIYLDYLYGATTIYVRAGHEITVEYGMYSPDGYPKPFERIKNMHHRQAVPGAPKGDTKDLSKVIARFCENRDKFIAMAKKSKTISL